MITVIEELLQYPDTVL